MKTLILSLFLIPTLSLAQDNVYYSASVGMDWPPQFSSAVGIRLHGGSVLDDNVFLGVGAGAVKFDNVKGVYVPAFFNVGFAWKPQKLIYPIIILQPGYGIYSQETKNQLINIKTTGGFTFYSGLGFGVGLNDYKIQVSGGYSGYGFKTQLSNNPESSEKKTYYAYAIRLDVVGL